MSFEKIVLEVVKEVTDIHADFYNGTLFLETEDSKIATDVYNAIQKQIACGIIYGKCASGETSYDFV
jgi:hypothetical protein